MKDRSNHQRKSAFDSGKRVIIVHRTSIGKINLSYLLESAKIAFKLLKAKAKRNSKQVLKREKPADSHKNSQNQGLFLLEYYK